MKLALYMPVWGRPALTSSVQAYYERFPELDCFAVVSPEDEEPPARRPRWTYVEAPNSPLGAKINAGLEVIRESAAGALLYVGSDDFLSSRYIETCMERIGAGYDMVHLQGCYYYDSRRLIAAPHANPGAGTCLSRRVLHRLSWQLVDPHKDESLDATMFRRLTRLDPPRPKRYKVLFHRDEGVCLDVKTNRGIWRLDGKYLVCRSTSRKLRLARCREITDKATFFSRFPSFQEESICP